MEPLRGAPCSDSSDSRQTGKLTRGQLAKEEDSSLIGRVLAGDDQGYQVLMERYSPMVLGFLCGKIGPNSDCEDLLQEAFLTAYRSLGGLHERNRFGPWLMKIVRNKCVDFQRKEMARPHIVNLDQEPNATDDIVSGSSGESLDGPAAKASLAETRALVLDSLAKLGDKYRTILYMRLIAEESPQDIARHLGLKQSAVRMRLMRGLKQLRRSIEKHGIMPSGVS